MKSGFRNVLSFFVLSLFAQMGVATLLGAQLAPVSYSMQNGQTGSYPYLDSAFTGSGDKNADGVPLTDGLGELTDGLIGSDPYWLDFGDGPAKRWVGWVLQPTITFDFGASKRINFASLHIATSTDVGLLGRARLAVSDDGTTFTPLADYVTSPADLANLSYRWLDIPIDSVGRYLRMTLEDNPSGQPWIFLSEVKFDGGSPFIYHADFETSIGAEWSIQQRDSGGAFSTFTGRYNNQAQTLTLAGLTPNEPLTLLFDLYIIDSWDGGGDQFVVEADGNELFHHSFANYNGDPPGGSQSYPVQPDSNRVQLGFHGSYVDAIYRNTKLAFTPSAATATITFRGTGLQDIGDESWGVDNVRVALTSELDTSGIAGTSFPEEGGSASRAFDSFTMTAFELLDASTAGNVANYSLRQAGPNSTFDDGDDVIWAFTPSFTVGRTVRFAVTGGPLQTGKYRFTANGLKDTGGATVTPYTLTFNIVDPILGKIESTSNDNLTEAMPLPVAESPAGSGLLSAAGEGTFDRVGDVDYWRFDAETGDLITIRVDAETGGTYPQVYIQDPAGSNYVTFGAEFQRARIYNFRAPGPGTYYLRVFSNNSRSNYRMRLVQARNLQAETEDNNSAPGNDLALTFNSGNYSGRITGAFEVDDAAGDYFRLGVLNVGNSMAISMQTPSGSAIVPTDVKIEVLIEGSATPVATSSSGSLNYTVAQAGLHFLRFSSEKRDTRAEYLATVAVTDGVAPEVTGVTLPAELATTTGIVNTFSVSFSEDLLLASGRAAANYDLRGAGADTAFDTADDVIYTLGVSYAGGLTASFLIVDGPTQPGQVRFTAKTDLVDRSENHLAAAFVRTFTVNGVPGFLLESPTNDSILQATPLGPVSLNPDGSFTPFFSRPTGGHAWGMVKGDFDSDGKLDLIVANYYQSTLAVMRGDGNGTFGAPTMIGGMGNPNGMTTGDLNGDGKLDLVVANRGGSIITLLGNGDGTFGDPVGRGTGGSPYDVTLADVNGDGKLDIICPNINTASVSVFLGTGDGTFLARADFPAGSGPISIVAGDLNGDGKVDLVTANTSGANITSMLGTGDGTFAAPAHFPAGNTPRWLAKGDFNGDSKMDVVVINAGDNTYTVLTGKGTGEFDSQGNKVANSSDPYHIITEDLNGDGKMDFAVASYGQARVRVYFGKGDATFEEGMDTYMGGNPIVLAAGDFNGDGRVDIATGNHAGNTMGVMLGNSVIDLAEDPSGSGIRTAWARGALANVDDADFWAFTGRKGDRITIAAQNPGNPGASGLLFELYITDAGRWWGFGADSPGYGQNNTFVLPYTGRFTVRVARNHVYFGEYRFRVTLAAPPTLTEDEYNGDLGPANRLALTQAGHTQSARVLGYISIPDNGDIFNLGQIAAGTTIQLSLTKPASSGLVPTLDILNASAAVATGAAGEMTLSYTIPAGGNGFYYARVRGAVGDFANQYLLNMEMTDTEAPLITSVTLPAEGSVNTYVSPYFSIGFNEDMQASTVTDNANYELRSAGANGIFDDSDDELYAVNNQGYSTGLSCGYFIPNGPMQPGKYRFTIAVAVQDKFGFGLAAPYVRLFTVEPVAGYGLENRNNNSIYTATPLAQVVGNAPDGSFRVLDNVPGSAANPWAIAVGDWNGDGNLDAAIGDYYDSVLSIYIGNGLGGFTRSAAPSPGPNPRGLAAADFNGDGKMDIVCANWGGAHISILFGNGDGTFQAPTNFAVGSTASCVAIADLNGDGRKDIVVGNWSSWTVSVLLGNGDGTFAPAVSLPAGANPIGIAARDLNGDGRPDIMVANQSHNNIGVFLGHGDGTFGDMTPYVLAGAPRGVDAADFNSDGKPDLVTFTTAGHFQLLLGNGDGTFGAPASFNAYLSDPYHLVVADLNLDGNPDVAIASYGNTVTSVMLGKGDGAFFDAAHYRVGGNPIAIASGDMNNDGRPDLLTANHAGRTLGVLAGNPVRSTTDDPVGSGFRTLTGRGVIDSGPDQDFWSFTVRAGDTLVVASETDLSGNSGLIYEFLDQDGDVIAGFAARNRGWGQSPPFKAGTPGTYFMRVRWNWGFTGEYRFRITLAPDPIQIERENNNANNAATVPEFVATVGRQTARIAGHIAIGDEFDNINYDVDHFRLGNLTAGTLIKLSSTKPSTSAVSELIDILEANGNIVASGSPGGAVNYEIPTGGDGAYFARVLNTGPSRAGDAGPYLNFNTGSQYVNTGPWAPSRTWTVEAWIRPDGIVGGRRGIVGSWSSCQDWGLVQNNGELGMSFKRPNGCGDVLTSGQWPKVGEWVHLAGTSDGNTARLYVNGVLVNSAPIGAEFAPTAAGVWIGGEVCCGNYFNGFIDDAAVWNRALTEEEIRATMGTPLLGTELDLMAFWRFEEGIGTTVGDSTGAHAGTAVNNPAWLEVGPTTAKGPGLMAQYILSIELSDTRPPLITSVTLPSEGSEEAFIQPYFNIGFSEDMSVATVNNAVNYELRSAGANDTFGNADDVVYPILPSAYVSGLGNSYTIGTMPLQPGRYRFTISTGLQDRGTSPLAAPYVREFSILALPGFQLEDASNDDFATADNLSKNPSALPDGSLTFMASLAGAGPNTHGIAAGDFNRDGSLDVAAVAYNSSSLYIYLGNGDGTFRAPAAIGVGSNPISVVVGDVNGDGLLDIATANYSSATVSILIGAGDGTFATPASLEVQANPRAVVMADFNKDGKLDVAAGNAGSSTVSMLIGNGAGGFAPAVNFSTGGGPHAIVAGDFNKDGFADIASANNNENRIAVLMNDTFGGFSEPTFYATQALPRYVATGDLDGDGFVDLVSINAGANTVSIYRNRQNGSFALVGHPTASSSDPYGVVVGDVTGDGRPDIIVASYGSSRLPVLENLGGGNFSAAANYYVPGNPFYAAIGDFNNDGRADVVTANFGNGTVGYLTGQGSNPLVEDPPGSGLRHAWGRGSISSNSDADVFKFSGNAGDRLELASETPGHGGNTGQAYEVYGPNGDRFYENYPWDRGFGQNYLTLPHSGTYYVRVKRWHGYVGEYRFRLTLAKPPIQMEYDPLQSGYYMNDVVSRASGLTYTAGAGGLDATVLGYLFYTDGGDVYNLGALSAGSRITATFTRPSRSTLAPKIEILDKNGTAMASNSTGSPEIDFTTTTTDRYYLRVSGDDGGMDQQYLFSLRIADTTAPTVASLTLPGAGETSLAIIDRFSIAFNEDMQTTGLRGGAGYSLRSSGADNVFDTTDDDIYAVENGDISGLNVSFRLPDGPLQAGNYRFRATSALKDLAGNGLAPFERLFAVAPRGLFALESRNNNTRETATDLTLIEDPTGLRSAFARGNSHNTSDVDYYSFNAVSGQGVVLAMETPGAPGASSLRFQIQNPAGGVISASNSDYNGFLQTAPLALTEDGTYYVVIFYNHDYQSEYDVRINLLTPPLQGEVEGNDNIASANTVPLAVDGSSRFGSIAGAIHRNGDLDYLKIPAVTAGSTVFLSVGQPASSPMTPTVSLYNVSNGFIPEAPGGRSSDSVAQVDVSADGDYYAVVRNLSGEGGVTHQYVLNVQIAPTDTVAFPNLQVTGVTPPSGAGILSGQSVPIQFAVQNVGRVATGNSWSDRVVLSGNTILGDADDLALGIIPHAGSLAPNATYDVNQLMTLPEGISGSFFVLVQTDFGNAVNEFILEGDNVTASSAAFNVARAPYADLVAEDITGIKTDDGFRVRWGLANRGTKDAGSFATRIVVRNTDTGTILADQAATETDMPINSVSARDLLVTTAAAAHYQILITIDTANTIYEFDAISHAHAEQNTFEGGFDILPRYIVSVTSNPAAAGTVGGGGTFTAGESVTVTAAPIATTLPYEFLNWTENGVFQSASANYTFDIARNRPLVANFGLPNFNIAATVNPAGAGTIAGTGPAPFASTATLIATARFGYAFRNWTENGNVVGSEPTLSVSEIRAHHTYVANFDETNLSHEITTATSPAGIATVTGGGTFNNGATATITAPASVTQNLTVYTFKRFTVGGVEVSASRMFTKTFATTDPTAILYVAEYDSRSLYPLVSRAFISLNNPIPRTTALFVTMQFNRSMKPDEFPTVTFARVASAGAVPIVATGGVWSRTTSDNDTYRTPAITVGTGMDGEMDILVAGGQDLDGAAVQSAAVLRVTLDATFPVISEINQTPSSGSATIIWTTDEPASSQVEYGLTSTLNRNSPLNAVRETAHSIAITGLIPDTDYHYKVKSIDRAGNETISDERTFRTLKAPDLIVDLIDVIEPVGGLQSGATFDVVWTDRNAGIGPTSGAWFDKLTVVNRTTGVPIWEVTPRYDVENWGEVASGATRQFRSTVTLPDGLAGVGQIAFTVRADTFGSISEDNIDHNAEANNVTEVVKTSTVRAYPDLQALNVAIAPAAPQSGQAITVTWDDSNTGSAPVAGGFRDRLLIRNNNTGAIYVDTLITHDPAVDGAIAPAAAKGRSFSYTLPDGAPGVGQIMAEVTVDVARDIFEFNAGGTAENNNTTRANVTSTLSAYPDLAVVSVTVPANAIAGSTISISYRVKNQGGAAASGSWSDYVYLSNDGAIGSDDGLAGFTFQGEIAAGATVDVTRNITLPQFGTGNRWVVVRLDSGNVLFESDEANNAGLSTRPIALPSNLILTLSRPSISESWGPGAAIGTITRNSGSGNSLEVTLTSSKTSEATVPSTVNIPASQLSITFPLNAINDNLVDGVQSSIITAAAPGFESVNQTIQVDDDDEPTIAIEVAGHAIREDSAPQNATVSRNNGTAGPLTVSLSSSDTSRITVPSSVVIPDGAPSVAFPISTVNNFTPNRPVRVTIVPGASGYRIVSDYVDVTDDDLPTLTLTIAEKSVSEGASNPATEGTVRRSGNSTRPLNVLLHSDNDHAARVPIMVTINGDSDHATFPITVVNDSLVDGAEHTIITAFTADSVYGTRIEDGTALATLDVTDDDGPTLTVTVDTDLLAERGTMQGHVSRNTPPDGLLVVNLTSSDTSEATVPATVTILAGQTTADFTVSGNADNVADGVQPVAVVATAAGFSSSTVGFNVSDIDLPDLKIVSVTAPATAITGSTIPISWVVSNDGIATANGPWVDRAYLSTSPDGSGLSQVSSFFRPGSLAIGETYSRESSILLPTEPGRYYLVVITDAGSAVLEGSERNNTRISAVPINLQPSYRATVSTVTETVGMQTPVTFTGRAFKPADNSPAPNVLVRVRVNVKGTRRTYDVRADAAGNFSMVFSPFSGEAGHVTIGADHPGVPEDPIQDEFSIYGMRFEPSEVGGRIAPNSEMTGEIELVNIGDLPLHGLSQTKIGFPPETDLILEDMPSELAGSARVKVRYKIVVGNFTAETFVRSLVQLHSTETVIAPLTMAITVAPYRPNLVATPGFLSSGIVRGKQRVFQFDVGNVGGAGSGPVEIRLPANTPWMSLITPSQLPALGPGEATRVMLAVNPPADMPLTRVDGSLVVVAPTTSVGVTVPFSFNVISDNFGDLKISVVDDFTYHVDGAPKVANATVVLVDNLTGEIVGTQTTDSTGIVNFTNVREKTYQMTVTAPKHGQYRAPVTIVPGIVTEQEIFIDRETVTYRWSVVPTQIEDKYRITLEADFETEVPIPVVTIDNPLIMPLVVEGRDTQFEVRLTNHGLLQAEHVHLEVPTHPHFEIIPLVSELDVLPARSSLSIPVLIRAKPGAAAVTWEMVKARAMRQAGQTPTGCQIFPKITAKWSFQNGPHTRWHSAEATVVPVYVNEAVWVQVQSVLPLDQRAAPKDLLIWGDYICDIAAAIASAVDECMATIVRAACGVSGGGDLAGAIGAARQFSACWCPAPPTTGGGGGGSGGSGGGVYGGISSYNPPFGGTPGTPIPTPIIWDYSAPCNPAIHSDGICARVRIRIVQEAVVTRAAFLGSLEIENGNSQINLTGIGVTLDIRDEFGNPAIDRFAITEPKLSGLTGVDGSGLLPAGGSGSAAYTMVPNRSAAPEGPTVYKIGGKLRYYEGESLTEVDLLPDTITVYPDPILNLDYFWQRDVFADDPFTPEIEPSEAFSLGLLVKNVGKGAALDFRITSAQPQIIENEKGLLIDFKIIGTQAGEDAILPSLTAQLGRIEPGVTRAAAWSIISSLQGKFMNYTATFEHIDTLGVQVSSLIENVNIHELIHQFQSQKPQSNGDKADRQPDFLANDVPDEDATPDTVWLTDGSTAPVNLALNPQADSSVSLSHLQVQVTSTMRSGWSYLKMENPGPGYKLYKVVRSDGLELLVPQNAWTTDRTFPGALAGAFREHKFHIIDYNSTGNYTLFYRVDDSIAPTVLEIGEFANVRTTPLNSATVRFSEDIDLATFDFTDIALTVNGGANLIDSSVTVERLEAGLYRVNGLGPLTDATGNYRLTVTGAGILDFGANAAVGSATAVWARTGLNPIITSMNRPTSPRNIPVATIDVTFSKDLDDKSFTPADLRLTLNDGPNLVGDVVGVLFLSPKTFRITQLGAVTGDNGVYRLTVDATGINDTSGNAGIGEQTVTWVMDVAPPRIALLEEIRTNPRNIVVPSLDVEFSEPISPATFPRADLSLTRNGGPNIVDGRVAITQLSPTLFRITDFSWVSGAEGTYLLTVNAGGVVDLAGNQGSGNASVSWIMDTTQPPTPTNLAIAPDTGRSATDLITRSGAITVTGSLGEDSNLVRFYDIESATDLGFATVTGRSFSKALTLSHGQRHIRVTSIDPAGNASEPYRFEPTIDLTQPTITVAEVAPDPRGTPVNSIDIAFSEEIDASTLTRDDIVLTRDGSANLIDGGVSILFVTGNTYRIAGLSSLTEATGLYELTVNLAGIADVAGNAGVISGTESWRRTGANTAPAIDQPSAKFASPAATTLVVQITGRDDDLPAQTLTFSLGAGAPSGAAITAGGRFTWQPTAAQAGFVYDVPIVLTDSGSPALTDTKVLRVTVVDYAELNLGRDILLRGGTAQVPVEFYASTPVSELHLFFELSDAEAVGLRADSLTIEVGQINVTRTGANRYRLDIEAAPGQTLGARKNLAELTFLPPLATSDFIWLRPTDLTVTKADLTNIPRVVATPGRVVAIGAQPLLEALEDGTGRRVTIYGVPTRSYVIERAPNLNLPDSFGSPLNVTLPGLFETRDLPNPTGTFYLRARQTSP